jgi:hypothetical protein
MLSGSLESHLKASGNFQRWVDRTFQRYGQIFIMKADGSDKRQLTDSLWEDSMPRFVPKNSDALTTAGAAARRRRADRSGTSARLDEPSLLGTAWAHDAV